MNLHALAQCPTGDIVLISQSDVAAFASGNPGCTIIEGNLTIGDPFNPPPVQISSLKSLSGITAVNGKLSIKGNDHLVTLDGLENLTKLRSLEIKVGIVLP